VLLQIIHLNIMIFRDLMPWSLVEGYQHFIETHNLRFQCERFYYEERETACFFSTLKTSYQLHGIISHTTIWLPFGRHVIKLNFITY